MITALIVDDEPYAREELADLLSQEQDIEIIGQCANALEALAQINQQKPQLVFLDIQMPQVTGIELIAMLDPQTMPRVIFTTAYDDFAIKAFEHNAYDYLLKPIEEERLQKTLCRLRHDLTPKNLSVLAERPLNHLPCYLGSKLKVVPLNAVEYVFSDLAGVHVATKGEYLHTHMTLKLLEQKTPLIRCHKQYLIAPEAIAEIGLLESGAEITTHNNTKVPVSRRYLKVIKQMFGYA